MSAALAHAILRFVLITAVALGLFLYRCVFAETQEWVFS
jgi:hypothetical protein